MARRFLDDIRRIYIKITRIRINAAYVAARRILEDADTVIMPDLKLPELAKQDGRILDASIARIYGRIQKLTEETG